ncbi:hypothetical protein GALL_10390 [mine drainage metagenome]|uniref:Uncharacterized protein n=1 Tax=mine drainage metagenome TaxID=410659 RepID=A0A1J5TF29_9ZZZZ
MDESESEESFQARARVCFVILRNGGATTDMVVKCLMKYSWELFANRTRRMKQFLALCVK